MNYKTHGTCAKEIKFDVVDNKAVNVEFVSGCPGNLLGIQALVEGMELEEIIARFDGIRCGSKKTSCPDQFAQALKSYINEPNA